jgi:hypothetical protein
MRRSQVIRQLREFIEDGGLSTLPPNEVKSPSAFITALVRREIVTAVKDPKIILPILQMLEKRGKIVLPEKTHWGGARKKKETE